MTVENRKMCHNYQPWTIICCPVVRHIIIGTHLIQEPSILMVMAKHYTRFTISLNLKSWKSFWRNLAELKGISNGKLNM